MKRRLRYIVTCCVTLLLCGVMLAGALQPAASAKDVGVLDYGIPSMESNSILLPSEMFEELFGQAPTDVEKAYLDQLSGISFTYNSALPADSLISTDYSSADGTLQVTLIPYTYTASNGASVTWIPQRVSIEGREAALTLVEDHYECHFDQLFHSDDFSLNVDFSWSVELPVAFTDHLWTSAYEAAGETLEVLDAHADELAIYEAAKNKYLAYKAYVESVEAYRQYTEVDLPEFEVKNAEYQAYCDRFEEYTETLAAYNAWKQYWAYNKFMSAEVQLKYLEYQAYLDELEPIKSRLEVLRKTLIADSHGWQVSDSIRGNAVSQVIANKSVIVAAIPEAASYIDAADEATAPLQALIDAYIDIYYATYPTEHSRWKALYDFYTTNYTELKAQFKKLYESLYFLGNKSAVIIALQDKGRMEQYFQFVAQLYVTYACLDDDVTLDTSWFIYHPDYSYDKVLEPIHHLEDKPADPTGVLLPEKEVPRIEKIEPIDRPTYPEVLDEPTEPTPVEKPTAPTPVEKPSDNPPAYAEDPGDAPSIPDVSSELLALAAARRDGTLPIRTDRGDTHTLTLKKTAACPVSIRNLKTVTFYGPDGKTVLDKQTLHYGTEFVYQGPSVVRPADEYYHYQFRGWVLSDGSAPSLIANSNLSLYAFYYKTPRFYTVTWEIDGLTETGSWRYGQVPNFSLSTTREPDKAYTYEFSGWDKEIAPVTGDVTYKASFLRTLREYTVTWEVGGRTETEVLPYGTTPVYAGDTAMAPDAFRYEFLGWDRAITTVSGDVTYAAEYRKIPLAYDEIGTIMQVSHTDTHMTVHATSAYVDIREAALFAKSLGKALTLQWGGFEMTVAHADISYLTDTRCRVIGIVSEENDTYGRIYRVGYFNSSRLPLAIDIPVTVTGARNSAGHRMSGELQVDGAWEKIAESGAQAVGAFTLRVCDIFSIRIQSNEPCDLSDFSRLTAAGTLVDLRLITPEMGYEIAGAEVVLANGTRIPVENLTFVMPQEAVTLELRVEKIIYRVSFVVNGVVIHTAEYGLLEEIVIPENPEPYTNGLYRYTFLSWSPSVQKIVYGENRDIVYEAGFLTQLIDPNSVKPEKGLFHTVLYAGIGAAVLLVAILALVILLSVKKRRAKRLAKVAVIEETSIPNTSNEEEAPNASTAAEETPLATAEAEEESSEPDH